MRWTSIARARALEGVRLILLRGFPSPWSQAARALFELKKIDFTPVEQTPDDDPDALLRWTNQESFPAVVPDDERPRSGWAEILLLAERLAPEPALIPVGPVDRAYAMGLSHEILGEMGLAWCRRLVGLEPHFTRRPSDPEVIAYRRKYGSSPNEMQSAPQRVRAVLGVLETQLHRQADAGRAFLVGDSLSAVDIYWAVTSNLFAPMPPSELSLPDTVRSIIEAEAIPFQEALDPRLLEHRDRIYREHLRLPIEL